MVGQEAYQTQGFDNPFATRFRLQVGIQPQREIQDLGNTLARVQGRRRILKNHPDALTAKRVVPKFQRMIVNQYFTAARLDHTREHFCQGRFARAVFTDNRQRLLFAQRKAQGFNSLDGLTVKQAGAIAKGLTQVTYFQ